MEKFRALITSKYLQQPDEHALVDRYLRSHDIEPVYQRCPIEADLIAALPDIDGLICSADPVTARVLETAPRLKVIVRTGVGYDTMTCKPLQRDASRFASRRALTASPWPNWPSP
jgi:phosphoglycerate dehydrogenase-like enzyme